MKYIAILLGLLISVTVVSQPVATLYFKDGTIIRNAPSGQTWDGNLIKGFKVEFTGFTMVERVIYPWSRFANYYGNWAIGKDSVGCECSFSLTKGDSLTYYFTGATEVEFHGEAMTHHGIADIYFNGLYDKTIDTYSPTNNTDTIHWVKKGLNPLNTYSFKMVIRGERNPRATSNYVVFKYFQVFNKPTIPPPIEPPNNQPDSVEVDTLIWMSKDFSWIRGGAYQVFVDGNIIVANDYDKAVEYAVKLKAIKPNSHVFIKAPPRIIIIK